VTEELNKAIVDKLDESILWELVRNARVSNAALAELLSVSPATIHHRLRRLRELGVWESNHAEVDWSKLGFNVHALVSVRLKPQSRSDLAEHMKRFAQRANSVSVYVLGGPTDLLVHVVCLSTTHLHAIVTRDYYEDPHVGYADAQVVYSYGHGSQHMELLTDWDDLRK
jgi:DNA-binding Lrp family transcriptional regulator